MGQEVKGGVLYVQRKVGKSYRRTFVVIVMLDYVQHHVSVTTILGRSWIYILQYRNIFYSIYTIEHLGATYSSIHYSSLWSAC